MTSSEHQSARAYPRLRVTTPLQVKVGNNSWLWNTVDISVGGLGAKCQIAPPPSTTLQLLFNLPNGSSVSTTGIVRYVRPDRVGIEFSDLSAESRAVLEGYTQRALTYTRSSGRISKRLYVAIKPSTSVDEEQIAETVVLSRNGGLLICRAAFKVGDELDLRLPDQNQQASIKIIFRRECGSGGLAELGFEIRDIDNFWQIDFPPM